MSTGTLRELDADIEKRTKAMAQAIRKRILAKTIEMKGGNFAQACSSAELFAALYSRVLNMGVVSEPLMPEKSHGVPGPANKAHETGHRFHGEKKPEYDRFYLSPVQYSIIMYAALIEAGRLAPEALDLYETDEYDVMQIGDSASPGMELMCGSLGQTISQAAGIAWARKSRGETGRTIVMLGDGELQEGQTWETFEVMSHYNLDNMVIIVDVNGHQVDGKVSETMKMDPLDQKLAAFGMRVSVIDGHDCNAITAACNMKSDGRPTVILASTDSCRGAEILRKKAPKLHFIRFSSDAELDEYRKLLDSMD